MYSSDVSIFSEKQCGIGLNTDFLGKFLEDVPGNGNGTFKDVETTYQSQHQVVYNNTTICPDIQNIKIANYSWFKYSCLVGRTNYFNDLDRVNCTAFTGSPLNEEELLEVEIETFTLFPNPAKELFYIKSNSKDEVNFKIYDLKGRLINRGAFNQLTSIWLEGLEEGIYNIQLLSKGKYTVKKVIVIND